MAIPLPVKIKNDSTIHGREAMKTRTLTAETLYSSTKYPLYSLRPSSQENYENADDFSAAQDVFSKVEKCWEYVEAWIELQYAFAWDNADTLEAAQKKIRGTLMSCLKITHLRIDYRTSESPSPFPDIKYLIVNCCFKIDQSKDDGWALWHQAKGESEDYIKSLSIDDPKEYENGCKTNG